MSTEDDVAAKEKRRKHAEYMRAYYHRNAEKWKARVAEYQKRKKAADPEQFRAAAAKRARKQRERKKGTMTPAERERLNAANRERNKRYKERDPEHWRELKRKEAAKLYRANPQKFLDRIHRRRGLLREGSVSAEDWKAILARYRNRCAYCRRGAVKLGQDHVRPLTRGGPHNPGNVVPCCRACNTRKNDRPWPFPEPPDCEE
jgi:hypothetical protein